MHTRMVILLSVVLLTAVSGMRVDDDALRHSYDTGRAS